MTARVGLTAWIARHGDLSIPSKGVPGLYPRLVGTLSPYPIGALHDGLWVNVHYHPYFFMHRHAPQPLDHIR